MPEVLATFLSLGPFILVLSIRIYDLRNHLKRIFVSTYTSHSSLLLFYQVIIDESLTRTAGHFTTGSTCGRYRPTDRSCRGRLQSLWSCNSSRQQQRSDISQRSTCKCLTIAIHVGQQWQFSFLLLPSVNPSGDEYYNPARWYKIQSHRDLIHLRELLRNSQVAIAAMHQTVEHNSYPVIGEADTPNHVR